MIGWGRNSHRLRYVLYHQIVSNDCMEWTGMKMIRRGEEEKKRKEEKRKGEKKKKKTCEIWSVGCVCGVGSE